eukprot:4803389-Prymnesium_polylepis.1
MSAKCPSSIAGRALRLLQTWEQRRELALGPLVTVLIGVVLAAKQYLAIVPRGEGIPHLARLVEPKDVLVEGMVKARGALVARVGEMHVGAQRYLLLGLAYALCVGDDLPRKALGIVLADDLLDVGRHGPLRRRVQHDRDAHRAHVGLLARGGVLLL